MNGGCEGVLLALGSLTALAQYSASLRVTVITLLSFSSSAFSPSPSSFLASPLSAVRLPFTAVRHLSPLLADALPHLLTLAAVSLSPSEWYYVLPSPLLAFALSLLLPLLRQRESDDDAVEIERERAHSDTPLFVFVSLVPLSLSSPTFLLVLVALVLSWPLQNKLTQGDDDDGDDEILPTSAVSTQRRTRSKREAQFAPLCLSAVLFVLALVATDTDTDTDTNITAVLCFCVLVALAFTAVLPRGALSKAILRTTLAALASLVLVLADADEGKAVSARNVAVVAVAAAALGLCQWLQNHLYRAIACAAATAAMAACHGPHLGMAGGLMALYLGRRSVVRDLLAEAVNSLLQALRALGPVASALLPRMASTQRPNDALFSARDEGHAYPEVSTGGINGEASYTAASSATGRVTAWIWQFREGEGSLAAAAEHGSISVFFLTSVAATFLPETTPLQLLLFAAATSLHLSASCYLSTSHAAHLMGDMALAVGLTAATFLPLVLSPDVAGTAAMLPSSFFLIAVIHTSCGLLAGHFLSSRQELLWQLAGSKVATGVLTGDAAPHITHRQTYARALRLTTSFMALLRAVALGCAVGSLFLGLLSPSCADEGIRSGVVSLVISVLSAMASLKLMALLCATALLGATMLARDTSWKSRADGASFMVAATSLLLGGSVLLQVPAVLSDPLADSGESIAWLIWEVSSFCFCQPASILLLYRCLYRYRDTPAKTDFDWVLCLPAVFVALLSTNDAAVCHAALGNIALASYRIYRRTLPPSAKKPSTKQSV